MNAIEGRLARERRTIEAMIVISCRDRHAPAGGPGRDGLCPECEELRAYAEQRLVHCPFGDDKPTCVHCKVHCYRAEMRERVREVMRHSGPKMALRHPVLAALHLWLDGRRPAPDRPPRRPART